jgi:bacterial/archaeal transporter family-2 protein
MDPVAIVGYLVFAFVAGAFLPLQVGVNAQLSEWVGSPVRASLVSFAVGTLVLGLVTLAAFRGWPTPGKLADVPWWAWTGGLLGAFYVLGSIVTGPRLGAVAFVAIVVAGQSVASLILDNFGLIGFKEHPISAGRIIGLLLLGVGVALVRIY